jgi:Fe-Mn family superoxide dismutase
MPEKTFKSLNYDPASLKGISQKTFDIHHDKLYAGYVKKSNDIAENLRKLRNDIISGKAEGNQTYSELRGLKEGETFAVNGVYLHEWYFDVLGGDGNCQSAPELSKAISEKWGSVEDFIKYFTECGMAARGWAVLAWDIKAQGLKQYNADAHNQGGIWGAIPIIVLDVYEHSYFIDFGSDRKSYIEAFFNNLNWGKIEEFYQKAKQFKW